MKTTPRLLTAILGLGIACTSYLNAGQGSAPPRPPAPAVFAAENEEIETESVTFLGVEVREVDPVLVDHLDLDEGIGLVVEMVTEESPASRAGLQENDILIRMGDQLLVTPRQFTVLVRREAEGAKVSLEILRKGKRSKLQAVLEKRAVPVRRGFYWMDGGRMPHMSVPFPAPDAMHLEGMIRKEMNRAPRPPHAGTGVEKIILIDPHRNMVFSDDSGTVEMTIEGTERNVVIKDAEGAVIYDGTVSSDDGLPDEVKERIRKLEIHLEGDLDSLPGPPEFDVVKMPAAPAI